MPYLLGRFLIASGCAAVLVCSAASAESVITLSTGETLTVDIQELTEDIIRFRHKLLGEVTLPRADVVVTETTPDDPSNVAEGEAAESAEPVVTPVGAIPPSDPPVVVPAPPAWKFKLVIAAGAATGNTENSSVNAVLGAVYETPEIKTALDTGYFFASSNGDRSENRFTLGGRHDWLNPNSKWFQFLDARFDADEFQSWDTRINSHVGLGYRLIQPPKLTVNLLGGVGAVKEFGSDNDDIRPEALFGVEGKYAFAEKHSIDFNSTIFPDLSDLGEYRWLNNLAWSFLIDRADKLSLTAGVQHEFQSTVDAGRKHSDVRLFAGVQLDF